MKLEQMLKSAAVLMLPACRPCNPDFKIEHQLTLSSQANQDNQRASTKRTTLNDNGQIQTCFQANGLENICVGVTDEYQTPIEGATVTRVYDQQIGEVFFAQHDDFEVPQIEIQHKGNLSPSITLALKQAGTSHLVTNHAKADQNRAEVLTTLYKFATNDLEDGILPPAFSYGGCQKISDGSFQHKNKIGGMIYKATGAKSAVAAVTGTTSFIERGMSIFTDTYEVENANKIRKHQKGGILYAAIIPEEGFATSGLVFPILIKDLSKGPDKNCNGVFDWEENRPTTEENQNYCDDTILCDTFEDPTLASHWYDASQDYDQFNPTTITNDKLRLEEGYIVSDTLSIESSVTVDTTVRNYGFDSFGITLRSQDTSTQIQLAIFPGTNEVELWGCHEDKQTTLPFDSNWKDLSIIYDQNQITIKEDNSPINNLTNIPCPSLGNSMQLVLDGYLEAEHIRIKSTY